MGPDVPRADVLPPDQRWAGHADARRAAVPVAEQAGAAQQEERGRRRGRPLRELWPLGSHDPYGVIALRELRPLGSYGP